MIPDSSNSLSRLDRVLSAVRRRWRLAILSIAFMDSTRFDPQTVATTRSLFLGLLIVGFIGFVLLPILQAWPRLKIARYAESRTPTLDGELITAVDAAEGRSINTSPDLASALVQRTARKFGLTHRILLEDIERPAIKRALLTSVVALVAGVLLFAASPHTFKHGAELLANPDDAATQNNPYSLAVDPGNSTVLEGEDFRVSATTDGFRPEQVRFRTRLKETDAWTQFDMRSVESETGDSNAWDNFVFNVDEAFEYQVVADGLESEIYAVAVTPKPQVQSIDLVYRFPKRTGRAPENVNDAGDIRAVEGTRVEIRVTPDREVDKGQLVVNGDRIVPLEKNADGEFTASLELRESGQYRVELQSADQMVPASREHSITALDDGLPVVQLLAPGRDAKVTSIEEVEFRVDASDDVAVGELELVVSVNGGDEEVIRLGDTRDTLVRGEHLMLLEELGLMPGDLVSYYARATDAPGVEARRVATDMYFLDVRPFEQSFRDASGMGGGGGGGGGGQRQQEDNLSAQQRTLVVALFKVQRDKPDLVDEVVTEKLDTLGHRKPHHGGHRACAGRSATGAVASATRRCRIPRSPDFTTASQRRRWTGQRNQRYVESIQAGDGSLPQPVR